MLKSADTVNCTYFVENRKNAYPRFNKVDARLVVAKVNKRPIDFFSNVFLVY